MRFFVKGKRILALVLAFVLIASNLPLSTPIFAVDDGASTPVCKCPAGYDTTSGHVATCPCYVCPKCGTSGWHETCPDTKYSDVIGKVVKLTSSYPWLWRDKTSTSNQIQGDASKIPPFLKIIDVYEYSSTVLLYQLDAADGYIWPEGHPDPDFTGKYWVESTKVQFVEPCPKCKEYGCVSDHANWCDICQKDDCGAKHESAIVRDSEGNEVKDSNGNPLKVTVTGDLPTGATVSATVPMIGGERLPNAYDIKVLLPDGTEWQPIDEGKTVTVSIPVDTDAEYVDVYHVIDYSLAIHNDVVYVPVNSTDSELLAVLHSAIETSKYDQHVAVDAIKDNAVLKGLSSFEVNSFSLYVWSEGKYVQQGSESTTTVEFKNGLFGRDEEYAVIAEYYATKDHLFTLTTSDLVTGSIPCAFNVVYDPVTITNGSVKGTFQTTVEGVNRTVNKEGYYGWLNAPIYTKHSATFTIPETAAPGETIVLRFAATYTFYMVIHIVDKYTVDYQSPYVEATGLPSSYTDVTDGVKESFTVSDVVPVPKDSHYTFVGWNTKADGTGITYSAGDKLAPKGDMTLYAMWNRENSVINFNSNNGVEKYDPQTVKTGTTIQLPAEPTRANYTFLGWSSATDDYTNLYPAGADYTVKQDATLYAIWGVELKITVIGGTLKLQKYGYFDFYDLTEYKFDDTDEEPIFEVTTSKDAQGRDVTTYSAIVPEGYFEKAIFKFSYASAMKPSDVACVGATISTVQFTNEIRATISDAGVNKNTTISFAAADKKIYTVSFESNGGSSVAPIPLYEGDQLSKENFPANPTRNGYAFLGWYDSKGTKVESISNISANVTLYARWDANDYTITINPDNGGATTEIPYNIEETVILPIPNRGGYSFAGWQVTTVAGNWKTDRIYTGSVSGMYGSVTLQAQWNPIVDLSIDSNGSLEYTWEDVLYQPGTTLNTVVPMGSYAGIELVFKPNQGYRIDSVTINGVLQQSPQLVNGNFVYVVGANGITEPLTIEVDTVLNQYTVTHVSNVGSAIAPHVIVFGADYTLPVLQHPGYEFLGWYLNDSFSGEAVTVLENVSSDVTVYARWEIITYTVKFDTQSDIVVNDLTFTVETIANAQFPTVERNGYDFIGWYVSADYAGSAYTIQTLFEVLLVDIDHTVTVYAKWERTVADLTISVSGNLGDQNFVFIVIDSNGVEVSRVVLHSGKTTITISGLNVGTYTVKPLDDWAWRQNLAVQTVVLDGDKVNGDMDSATFTWSAWDTFQQWLNGYSYNSKNGG